MSGDGEVDGSDVFPFTTCVTMGISTGNCACGDMNGDGVVDADDVECFLQKVLKGESDCDGIVICEEGSSFTFYASGGSNASGNASAEPITWATVAAAGVAASVSACASQSSLLGIPENGDVDVLALALRWVSFETWVTAHPIENFAGSSDSYDAWAKLQFNRVVLEGKDP